MGTVSAVQTPQGSCDNMDSLDLLTDSLRLGGDRARSLVEHKEEEEEEDQEDQEDQEEDKVSLASLQSRSSQLTAQHSWTPGTRPDSVSSQSSLPTYSQAMSGNKKKIIPVQSDSSESAPSSPSSPSQSPQPASLSLSARFRKSQQHQEEQSAQSLQAPQPPQTLGQKLKNSYSE